MHHDHELAVLYQRNAEQLGRKFPDFGSLLERAAGSTDDLVETAQRRLAAWRRAGAGAGALDETRACLDDDLDLPSVLLALDRAVADGHGVADAAALIGVELG